MNRYYKSISVPLLALGLFFGGSVKAQKGKSETEASDKVMLYFRFNESSVDPHYLSNASRLRLLDSLLAKPLLMTHLDSLGITAYASPDGNPLYNARLAGERAKSIQSYLLDRYPFLANRPFDVRSVAENWEGLKMMVEADKEVPAREEVLAILREESNPVLREYKLRQLNEGTTWRYIERKLMKYLRGSAFVLFYVDASTPAELNMPGLVKPTGEDDKPAPPAAVENPVVSGVSEPVSALAVSAFQLRRPVALKTNLLFDAATLLNVEVEVPVAPRFSIAGEWIFPWWLWENKQNCLEVLSGNLEARYWFKPKYAKQGPALGQHNPLSGWFVGLYGGGGLYDLERNREGYQGEFFIATGLSGGYVLPIKRNLSMEFSLGVGVLRTKYRHYHAEFCEKHDDWHLIRQNSGQYTWVGPTRAKISLVWYPHFKLKKKGGNR